MELYERKCTKNPCNEYVGKTKRTFQARYYNHISYVRTEKTSEVSGEHFPQKGHKLEHMKGLLIEKAHNPDPVALSVREKYYVNKFDSYKRRLNRD